MNSLFRIMLVTVTFIVTFSANAATKVTVFAAASLTNALQDISNVYQKDHKETEIVFSFASSSVLAKQIEHGAPADIFISADQKWMTYLIDKNITHNKENLLKNQLVLVAPVDAKINNVTINQKTDWTTLLPTPQRIAVGDPSHVPAGIYAKESLTHLGAFDKLSPQFAAASNVREALMLVERNEANLGIVYATDAKVSNKVKIVGTFPADSFTPIEYPMTLLTPQANDFYHFLQSNQAKTLFLKYGFITQ